MQLKDSDAVQDDVSLIENGDWNGLVQQFHEHLKSRSWYIKGQEDWWHQVAQRTVQRMLQQQPSKSNGKTPPNDVEQWLKDGVNAIFFDPEIVEMIYSPIQNNQTEFINYGANLHCRWSESVVKSLVYRHTNVVSQMSVQPDTLIDELWGMVMEETVICLTDVSVHLWKKDGSHTEFPPPGTKGRRRGSYMRAAMSSDDKQIASYRIDHQLLIWDTNTQECIKQIDCSALNKSSDEPNTPSMILFSNKKNKIALEYADQSIAVLSLTKDTDEICWFYAEDQARFEKLFGKINLPHRTLHDTASEEKIKDVYDWMTDESGSLLLTASRSTRQVPDWMHQAGFERSIRHIAKKRLIDLIRKYSHTAYACWQCGSMQSTIADTQCRNCDADFTKCPIGCDETISAGNHWQCPSCGYTTRHYQAYQEVEPETLDRLADTTASHFQDDMDYQKLVDIMSRVYVTYKNRNIPCAELIRYKSDGCTNETIGKELNIPRGTVDYLWNQCKSQIQKQFGFSA